MASTTRRGFLGTGSAAGIGYFVAAGSRPAWSNSAIEQMNLASIGVGGKGDMTDEGVLWRYYRSIPQLPSPLISSGAYYLVADQGGLVTTITADKGELLEKSRVGEAGDAYFASPVS